MSVFFEGIVAVYANITNALIWAFWDSDLMSASASIAAQENCQFTRNTLSLQIGMPSHFVWNQQLFHGEKFYMNSNYILVQSILSLGST